MRFKKEKFMWYIAPYVTALGLYVILNNMLDISFMISAPIGLSSWIGMKILAYYKFTEPESQQNFSKVITDE